MRWILIDEFRYIRKGDKAQAVKCVTRSEEPLLGFPPHFPVYPSGLMIEMMAQVGGVLIGANDDFRKEVLLAKVTSVEFYRPVKPPAELVISAHQLDYREEAGLTECEIMCKEEKIAKAQIFFGVFDSSKKKGTGSESFPFPDMSQKNYDGSIVFSDDFLEAFAIRQRLETS